MGHVKREPKNMVLQETPCKYCNEGCLNRCTTANPKVMRLSKLRSPSVLKLEGRKEGNFKQTIALESDLSHTNSHVDETIY